MTIAMLVISFFVFLFIGVPIAVSLGLSALITIVFATDLNTSIIVQQGFNSLNSFPLMAIPFFILAGVLMGKGGVSSRLLDLARALVGFLAGGLAMVTVTASMFFSAISGSGPAAVAAIGSFMIPSMKKNNYGHGFAAAITASSGSMGVLIPPSIPFVMYGITGSVSIGALFLAGIIPGIMVGVSLMILAYVISKKENYAGTGEVPTLKDVSKAFWNAKWALLVPVIILGGIYGGFFSPTESAAVAAAYAFLIGAFVYRELKWKDIYDSFAEAALINATTVIIIGFSISFAYVLTIEQIPVTIADFITGISESPFVILLIMLVVLLIVGMFIDTISAIVVLTPILLPIATEVGVDPIHFGVVMVLSLAIGFVTPPLGVNLFVASGVGNVHFESIVRAAIPMIIVMILCLVLVAGIPALSMFLPEIFE
ncbi:TRAP transporter large permease [Salicibibacter halophilus]|uniref:TRAP transporter large permease n=1 Tax=Salicibibacter halophilus TaxID=2502791 RepID=A0A514LL95_9BACI|nr:TRAP transporter large permease [Salicibibacter halophilus]QDI92305.1 TRAP transporter large permease [Salicibibacter halophilus]